MISVANFCGVSCSPTHASLERRLRVQNQVGQRIQVGRHRGETVWQGSRPHEGTSLRCVDALFHLESAFGGRHFITRKVAHFTVQLHTQTVEQQILYHDTRLRHRDTGRYFGSHVVVAIARPGGRVDLVPSDPVPGPPLIIPPF